MKKLGFVLCTVGLLVGCGSAPAPKPELQRVPDVEAQLPELKDFPSQTQRLRAQASTLPAWNGEKVYGAYQDDAPEIAVTNEGAVLSAHLGRRGSANFIRVWNSSGTLFDSANIPGSGTQLGFAVDPEYTRGSPLDKVAWTVRPVGGSNASAYELSSYNRIVVSQVEGDLALIGPSTKALSVYDGVASEPVRQSILDVEFSGGNSVAFVAKPPTYQRYVNIYETSGSINGSQVERVTPVLFPKSLAGFVPERVTTDFAVGQTDSSTTFYVAMAFPAKGCADAACPSLMNVQQVRNGRVQWSRVWTTEEPVTLRGISANKNEVILLTSNGSANPDSAAAQSQLTWVSNGGDVFLRARVPLELWRRDWARGTLDEQYKVIPNLTAVQSDDSGKLLLSNRNVVMTGTFSEGIGNIYLLNAEANPELDRGFLSDAKFNGEYVYAAGYTSTRLGKPSPTASSSGQFILPLDFQLNER